MLPGQFGYGYPELIAHFCRVNMLIAFLPFTHAGNMEAALMAESAGADIRHKGVRHQIGHFADIAGDLGQFSQLFIRNTIYTQFEFQVGNNNAEISITAAFSVAVDSTLDLSSTGFNCRQRIGNRQTAIIMSMDTYLYLRLF